MYSDSQLNFDFFCMPTFNRILIFACQDIFEFPYALYDFFSLAFWVTMQREFVRESYMHSGLPLAVSNLFFSVSFYFCPI